MQRFSPLISFHKFGYNIVHAMEEEDSAVFISAWSIIISLISNSTAEMASFQMAMATKQQSQSHLQLALNKQKKKVRKRPSFWVFPRPSDSWLEHTLYDERIPESTHLRITKATFWMLVRIRHKNLIRKPSNFRESLSPEKFLAIVLYKLATWALGLACADVFIVGKTTRFRSIRRCSFCFE